MKSQKNNGEKRVVGCGPELCCCDGQDSPGVISDCCQDTGQEQNCCAGMGQGMRKCRWFLLAPVILGVLRLLMGYYLDARVTRMLWMVTSALVILLGILAFGMVSSFSRRLGLRN